jgi:hypothetical protein
LGLRAGFRLARGRKPIEIPLLAFDAATFAGSVLLLIGVAIDRNVLRLMGDTQSG